MRTARRILAPALVALVATSCGLPRLPGLPRPRGDANAVEDREAEAEWQALARGRARARGCFAEHLGDAIRLNDARATVYSAWSERRSESVSERLIRSERTALAIAKWVDRKAAPFQEDGIPIVCAEFVSMERTPPLPDAPLPRPAERFAGSIEAGPLQEELIAAYGESGFAGVAARADDWLARLAATPAYNCMTRHLVESIWRVAFMAPLHERLARERRTGSTRELSEIILRLHLSALPEAEELDRAAAPLQERGIPIVCNDVPPIR